MRKILLITLTLSLPLLATTPDSTKVAMQEVMENYVKLIPFIYSNSKSSDQDIDKKLMNLERSFLKANHTRMIKSANFAPSIEIVTESIEDIKKIHQKGDLEYSKYRAKKLMTVCISCHSQLPNENFSKISTRYDKVINEYVRTPNDKAMVAYFLRDYEKSLTYFKQVIAESLENPKSMNEKLEDNLLAILKIYLVNLKDEIGAKKYFTQQMNLKNIPKIVSSHIASWVKALAKEKTWMKKGATTEDMLKKIIAQELTPMEDELFAYTISSNAVDMYRAKAVLSQFAVKHPKSELMPEILYWTGLIEGQESSLYLYSLGELYLKECVDRYPKSKRAPKCYKAYEEMMIVGFTGSAGTHLPRDISESLKKMKQKISQ